MKRVFGYVRVSTTKQGKGVSLQEQKESIIRYADKNDFTIVKWFEEKETASKQGRPYFTEMMSSLRKGQAEGVIMHKIDRGTRNLKDWAVIGDFIDDGVEIHFAHESLDLKERGGRLAADIQAVIASDYIRNLRQETIKGLYGRLKQGYYPYRAPIGYLDNGGGKEKTIDPIKGPLIKKAFKLYSTGNYSLKALTRIMEEFGLTNSLGNKIYASSFSLILNNPFYAGIIKIKGKTFSGKHKPLISSDLFNKTQEVLHGKTNLKIKTHTFLFQKMIKCNLCGRYLTAEKQKGHVYYRCHTKNCSSKCVREDLLSKKIVNILDSIQFSPNETQAFNEFVDEAMANLKKNEENLSNSLNLQHSRIEKKFDRLTNLYIDGAINKEKYESSKEELLIEKRGIESKKSDFQEKQHVFFDKSLKKFELYICPKKLYEKGNLEEKREIIKNITSNLAYSPKKPEFTLKSPYSEIINRHNVLLGAPDRNGIRTFKNGELLKSDTESKDIIKQFSKNELKETLQELFELLLEHIQLSEENEEGRN
jgi:site-specific DNA recombinase